ncbi:breast cancer type 2 susceptibility protein isoform X2 [Electrophorus electricus]|uniref:breast cancer type 2 susceptibility protein isoform X2 n=1 Tax=Electrophorus electricus TaxID=8005 RepID=UPI0015CFFB45|nr:breast cancer type 2 susceptibility protein isoform X2 [Electrophorus electricus]
MDMFEDVLRGVEAELGPLNIHWFEELTVKASRHGHQPVAEVQQTSSVSRAPADTPTLDSQVSSTPKMLRCRTSESPFSFLGDFSAPGMQTPLQGLLRTDSNPCLFGSAKDSQRTEKEYGSRKTNECFGLLDTPISSLVQDSEAKRISESLGAQMNPDISWSSSFNTPSTLTPTVILSRQETQSSPIVRNLFPSLSKDTHPASERQTSVQHIDLKGRADAKASNTSLDDLDGLWKQTVPDAIKDADVRGTVKSVLDGAEDVLSIFFSKSSSALRRVKTKARIKKRTTLAAESFAHLTLASNVDLRSVETCTAVKIESPPISKDLTQWTPLSLSDVPDSKTKQIIASELANKQHNNLLLNSDSAQHTCRDSNAQVVQSSCAVEKLQCFPDSYSERAQARGSFMEASPSLTLARKPRRFVYRVQSPCPSTEVGKGTATPVWSSDTDTGYLTVNQCLETSLFEESKHGEDARTKDTGDHMLQAGETTGKQMTWSTLSVDQGLNMTQLCEAFAEDFTQGVNLDKSPNQRAHSKHDSLGKSSCIKISKEQPNTVPKEQSEGGVGYKCSDGNYKETNAAKVESMTCEHPRCDSGYPSFLSDSSRVTICCSGSESYLHSVFKTANNKDIYVQPEALMKAKAMLDERGQCTTARVVSGIPEPTKPSLIQVLASPDAVQLPSERHGHGLNSGRETSNLSTRGLESGFVTASSKSITVSSDNLEKAKDIFKEFDENTDKLQGRNVMHDGCPVLDFKSSQKRQDSNQINVDSSLTASQKADVTELCSILEEACSQYEFTQVRPTKLGLKPLDSTHVEKDWDSDILADIDFDDSFNCAVESRLSQKYQTKIDSPTHQTPVLNSMHSKDESIQAVSISQPCCKTLKVEPNTSDENESYCSGFKTASGKTLSVSDKCLSKAKSLFADLEDSEENIVTLQTNRPDTVEQKLKQSPKCHTTEPSPEACNDGLYCTKKLNKLELKAEESLCNENSDSVMTETEICKHIDGSANLEAMQRSVDQKLNLLEMNAVNFGFKTAGGKEVKVSEKALVNAKRLLNEVENFEARNMCEATVSLKAPPKTKAVSCILTPVHDRSNISTESLRKVGEERFHDSTEKKCQPSQSIQSDGFKLASGKGVSVSASAIQMSKAIFRDIENSVNCSNGIKLEDGNTKLDSEANRNQNKSVKVYKMASSRGVSISEKAFKEAKTFFKDYDLDCSDISQEKGDKSSVMDDCGFKAVVVSMVHLPEMDRLNKEALSLKQQSTALNKHVREEFAKTSAETLQSTSGCSFSTANGKTVSVSAEALQRAKAVLADSADTSPCEKRMEISEEKNVPEKRSTIPGRSWNFSTASGKKVAVSDKALRKAKSLFSECEVEGSLLDEGLSKTAETSATEPECARCLGFSTASGKGVAVSEKALMEVKTPFDNCADLSVDVHDIESHLNMPKVQQKSFHGTSVRKCIPANAGKPEGKFEIVEDGDSEADALKSGNVGFSMASGKGVTVSKSALEAALPTFKECDAEPAAGVHGESPLISECQASGVNENNQYKMGQIIATVPSFASLPAHGDSSLLNCRSLNTGGCNETQQKYLEQEAMACTKALLEDDLDEHSLLEDTGFRESRPEHKLSIEANIARKRMSDGRGLTGQPPLKRRLVSEFNQISDGSRVCTPATSSPNGTLNDRRVFTCNLHLKPNITLPSRDVTERKAANPDFHVAFPHSADQKRAAANLKATVFVPPFQKNSRPEAPKPCVSTDIAKGPSVFVPPFKKEDSLGGIDLLRSPSHNSSVSKSSSILSSGQENKMTFVKGKAHIVGTQEDWKKETEAQRDVKLGSLPTGTSEDKVFEVWQQSLELARDIQDMRIRKKKRQTVRPLPGSLYLAKTSGVTRISLREAVGHKNPVQHTQEELYQRGVHRKVSQISSENAESFRFGWAEFFGHEALAETGGVQLADGGWLIPNNEASAGKEEFYRALCDTPGVDPKLISEAWVYNHYRWIVWKQASMERTFPEVYGGLCLTPEQVLLQLKLRYDIEVDHSRRSALKKIMEMDDTPAKTLVLCVCGIATSVRNQVGTEKAAAPTDPRLEAPAAVVWLTDGWYSIKSLLDLPLSSMLQKGRLRVGGKIIVHGAELIGSQDACAPLEAPDSLMLKISANSTRPARWDAKMGFHKDPRPFQVSLSSLYSTGGVVGCVDIIVLRSYPTQWMEKLSGGIFVFRNERAEDREARRHSSAKQKNLELLFFKIQAQFEKEEEKKKKTRNHRRTFTRQEIERLQDGEELYEAVESDPGYMETHLSVQQVEAVNSYRRGVAEQRQAELQERVRRAVQEAHKAEGGCLNRDVTPVWKLAIADSNDQHGNHVYTLNIWRPSAELSSLLREGGRYKAYHLATSETKKHSASAHVQFTATKKTQFQELEVCPEQLSKCFPLRRVASFRELQDPRFSSPCGEVDLVGYVISVLDRQGSSPLVYLVDDGLDFVSVRTSGSLVQLAVEDLVRPMALLAVSNLRPQQLCAPVPDLYAGEQSLFSTHPKDPHIKGAMARINSFVQGYKSFFSVAEEKLSNLIPPGCSNSFPSLRTPGFLPKQNIRIATPQQAGRVFSPFTPVSKPSPSPAGGSEPKDPRSVKRKRGIDYLSRIPSPPPITPLGTGTSPSVNRTFNPPRRSETPQCPRSGLDPSPSSAALPVEEQWVKDEELALINTQALDGMGQAHGEGPSST